MPEYDVVIVGGGISGLSCGMVLGSGIKEFEKIADKKVLIIDNHRSDALRAAYFNAPGVSPGITGKEALEEIREQLKQYPAVAEVKDTVLSITETESNFEIKTKLKDKIISEKIVLATGFRQFKIKDLELPIKSFTRTSNPTRVAVEHKNYKVRENIYACGLFSDVSSQFPIVAGTGGQTAINIMYDWTGEWLVIHDKP